MKVQYLGTAAAEGMPAFFCDCDACKEARKRGESEFHTRSQFMIDGCLGIDFPPEAYAHALKFGVDYRKLRHLFITHSHTDHCYLQDLILRGYKYTSPVEGVLTVYGNKDVVEVFRESTRRELKKEVSPNLRVLEINAFTTITAGEYQVTPLVANHGKSPAYVYLVESGNKAYLHLTDTGRLPKETLDFLGKRFADRQSKVGLVTFDCTFLFNEGGDTARHMGLPDNYLMQKELLSRGVVDNNTKFAMTHYSHNSAPLKERLEEAEKQSGYIATYDGTAIEF